MDHFRKFHLLGSLIQRTQAGLNLALPHMFRITRVPAILHTDNGLEFGALDRLLQQLPESIDIVHNVPRGNRVLEGKIAAMEATYGDGPAPWHIGFLSYNVSFCSGLVIQLTI
ncbi:hypothetical protein ACJMK2_018713 [Sinanodonta woodiana]|uniref:Integrase catalytic domain-containing protein n=1 Tax=Sinanodonta woodiana TaxID=1069815 RepID=A0ABD3UE94_SINWO